MASFSYDGNGNFPSAGSVTYSYDPENRLSGAKTASPLYDPLGRLVRVHDGNTANARWFVHDGDALVAEFDGNGTMLKRYLHSTGVDEPLAWLDGTGTAPANRHDMFANAEGSVIDRAARPIAAAPVAGWCATQSGGNRSRPQIPYLQGIYWAIRDF